MRKGAKISLRHGPGAVAPQDCRRTLRRSACGILYHGEALSVRGDPAGRLRPDAAGLKYPDRAFAISMATSVFPVLKSHAPACPGGAGGAVTDSRA
ncbi:hypothetical protein RC1_2442 [Rhodospirillum centenum SW]|uniref:Uncharacterized protein n=1 Tax=Rhodospirillum centenum (strain ATCC 51521 / SW) TaxID=414684 RepID=B6IUK0_RHOCS|nr:hypothetical protein RC1_2442 [Rhodospirillum centenum SW]